VSPLHGSCSEGNLIVGFPVEASVDLDGGGTLCCWFEKSSLSLSSATIEFHLTVVGDKLVTGFSSSVHGDGIRGLFSVKGDLSLSRVRDCALTDLEFTGLNIDLMGSQVLVLRVVGQELEATINGQEFENWGLCQIEDHNDA